MSERRYWFRKRDLGLGWTPISKEGWAAAGLLTVAILVVGTIATQNGWGPLQLVAASFLPVALFIPIAILKCEP